MSSSETNDGNGPIQLTEEAAAFVRARLAQEGRPQAALRVGVKGGGCNGLMYVLDYTDEPPKPRDRVYDLYGVKVYVDDRSLDFIEGSTIRYENTLMFQGLKFDNPLETSTCGCGETFSVSDEVKEKRKARARALRTL
jgi:iron-sulfur cluster assembly protein